MIYPLFETIAIKNGKILNIEAHQQRYIKSLTAFYKSESLYPANLLDIIQIPIQYQHTPNLRCRIDYNDSAFDVAFFPYQSKSYQHFKPVICDDIDYHLKYSDRSKLNALFEQRQGADEIIIIKQGWVTDCSIGNLIFKQNDRWFTPSTPLLAGTQRQKLLAENRIQEREIRLEDIDKFSEIRLINALNGLE